MNAALNILMLLIALSPTYFIFQNNGAAVSVAYVIIILSLFNIHQVSVENRDRLSILYDEVQKTHQLFDRIESLKDEMRNMKG